jgi:ABC-2 type transport system permease protein
MGNTKVIPGQLSAIAQLRWWLFVNSLRTRRGKMELVSRIIVTSAFALGGVGGFFAIAGVSWYFVSHGNGQLLAIPLWIILFFWQVFPVMATAFTNNPDSSELLRFPLTYRSYFLVRLAYGFLDPASALGCVGLFGVLVGVTAARPPFFPWTVIVLVTFALFNLVLMQTIFAWLERWLAQRRTREVLGVLFILATLSFQMIGPLMQQVTHGTHPQLLHSLTIASKIQSVLPPGLAADAISQALGTEFFIGFTSLLFLATVTVAVGLLLNVRIRAQFHGENLGEVAARPLTKEPQTLQVGWDLPGFSHSVAAVFEKEIRYLSRSGPMLLTLIMPIFMLVVIRLGPLNAMRHSGMMNRTPDTAFPSAAAYSLLILTNLVYNSFGGDGGGMQFFYASPARFHHIVLGKNLTHAAVLVATTAFAWLAVTYLYGAPHLAVTIATFAGLLFAAPLNFTAGNLLSLYAPKKRDFSTFGRQNVSQTTVLASFGMQIVIIGFGAAVFALSRLYHNLWIAAVLFLLLSAISIPVYVVVLRRMDGLAIERRETLLAELCRA